MAEPIKATVIRAWDNMTITAWFDEGAEPWFNIRAFKIYANGNVSERCIRLSPDETNGLRALLQFTQLKVKEQ